MTNKYAIKQKKLSYYNTKWQRVYILVARWFHFAGLPYKYASEQIGTEEGDKFLPY